MKRIINIVIILIVANFFFTQKNLTIDVSYCEVVETPNSKQWLVHTTDDKTYNVPYDEELNFNLFSNFVIFNFNASDDWKTLQKTGLYHVRVYGIKTLFTDNNLKIVKILDSPDEKPAVIAVFNIVKSGVMPLINGMKDYGKDIVEQSDKDVKEFEKQYNN